MIEDSDVLPDGAPPRPVGCKNSVFCVEGQNYAILRLIDDLRCYLSSLLSESLNYWGYLLELGSHQTGFMRLWFCDKYR